MNSLNLVEDITNTQNNESNIYIENENNYDARIKLQKMLPKFKLIKLDKIINFKDSNINMVFKKK